jgi:hypothetical protein
MTLVERSGRPPQQHARFCSEVPPPIARWGTSRFDRGPLPDFEKAFRKLSPPPRTGYAAVGQIREWHLPLRAPRLGRHGIHPLGGWPAACDRRIPPVANGRCRHRVCGHVRAFLPSAGHLPASDRLRERRLAGQMWTRWRHGRLCVRTRETSTHREPRVRTSCGRTAAPQSCGQVVTKW